MSALAQELREALDDPKRGEWGGYPWEHLGDAERDVRELLAYVGRLESALTEIADADYRGNRSSEQELAHRALVAEGLRA